MSWSNFSKKLHSHLRFLQLFEDDRRKVSCVMVPIEDDLRILLVSYACSIPDDDLYKPETSKEPGGYGRELKPHVTALFGLLTDDPNEIKPILKPYKEIKIKLGRTSLFEKDEYHVLKLDVESDDMTKLNAALMKMPNENEYPDYHPHLTLAYLKPDKAISSRYVGAKNFDDCVTVSRTVIFSDPDRRHTRLRL